MGDGDARYPGSHDGDVNLDVAVQGGKSSISAVAGQRSRLHPKLDAVDLPAPPHRYISASRWIVVTADDHSNLQIERFI